MTARASERTSVFREKDGGDLRSLSLVVGAGEIEATLRLPGCPGLTLGPADLDFLRRALNALPELTTEPPPVPATPAPLERMGRRWSEAEDGMLRQFLGDGLPIAAIGQSLRRSPAGIISRMYHLGLIKIVPVPDPDTRSGDAPVSGGPS